MQSESSFKLISVIPSAEQAGTELAALSTSLLFKESGYLVEIWTMTASENFDCIAKEHSLVLRKFPIHPSSPLKSLVSLFRLSFYTGKYRNFSVFHAYLPKPIILMFILSRVTRVRYVAGIRGEVRVRGKIAEFLLRKALNSAVFVVCNARHLQEDTIRRFKVSTEKTLVIRNMVKSRAYVEKSYMQTTSAIVLSNFIKYKGHDVLLEALQVSKSKPKVFLVGQGAREQHIRGKITELGLDDSVSISTHQEFEKILENAQFAIHPSETEGFSNAILEEMSFGLPVIAFAIEGNLELIKDNINGLLVPPGNIQAFSKAIDSLSDRRELRTRLSIGAKETADEYSAQKLFENLEEVYLLTWKKKCNNLQSFQDGSSGKLKK